MGLTIQTCLNTAELWKGKIWKNHTTEEMKFWVNADPYWISLSGPSGNKSNRDSRYVFYNEWEPIITHFHWPFFSLKRQAEHPYSQMWNVINVRRKLTETILWQNENTVVHIICNTVPKL